jgi:uroporphyrinogen decarboxylase
MNSRERVLAAFAHREADRVPVDIGTSDTFLAREVYEGLADLLGLEPTAADGVWHPGAFLTPDEAMLEQLGADVRLVGAIAKPGPRDAAEPPPQEQWPKVEELSDGTTQWIHENGAVYRRPAGVSDAQHYLGAIRGGLTPSEIDRVFPASPPPRDWADPAGTRAAIAERHQAGKAVQCNSIIMPVTGTAGGILDFSSWCLELATQPDLLCRLMDRYLEHAFASAESFYRAIGDEPDVVYGLGDDVASQAAMWMSPVDYRRHVKPRHAAIVRFIKARTKAKIIFHCCGACRPILPDLIEIGVDALNPTQTSAGNMDPFELKRDFGDDIVFWGGIDVIELLPRRSAEDVAREVKRHIDALAPGGGYILGPSHIIQRHTPPENVLAMYKTALEYGVY